MPPQSMKRSDFPALSTPGVTKGSSSPLMGLERTMHGTRRELVKSQRAPGHFAVLQKGKDKTCHESCLYILSYRRLDYRGGDDYYLM